VEIITSGKLSVLSWLVHGFSTRKGGHSPRFGLNLGSTKNEIAVDKNRTAFLRALGAGDDREVWPLVTLRQIHSDLIHCVDAPVRGLVGDGLITRSPGLVLAVQTADCLPIILVDTKKRAVGVFHAGWRGTLRRIVEKGVGEMRRHFGSRAADMKAAIGPGIHSCCYEVGVEVREKFESQFGYAAELFREVRESDPVREKYPLLFLTARAPGHSELPVKLFLDLAEANRRQLLAAGVAAKNIEVSELCTNCRVDMLFSYRAEKGKTGRMMGAVGMRSVVRR
jgi:YfiH family protein